MMNVAELSEKNCAGSGTWRWSSGNDPGGSRIQAVQERFHKATSGQREEYGREKLDLRGEDLKKRQLAPDYSYFSSKCDTDTKIF